ncbi:MAG: hypothetical protein SGJ20_20865 [Planctomycetota bacterium]|nr:hypothetical protein [Planctomycetota bacterium]
MTASEGGEATAADIEDAKQMIQGVFGVMEIKQVIIVDDQLSNAPDVSIIVGAIQAFQMPNKSLPSIADFAAIDFTQPERVWRPQLESAWESMAIQKRQEAATALGAGSDNAVNEERSVLEQILDGYKPRFLSLGEWNAEKDLLIETAREEAVLFVFDQDMTQNQGASDEGMKSIAAILKGKDPPTLSYCGLLSHHVKINDEYEDHQKFAQDYELLDQKHRFAVISKKHLEKAPGALALRLKRVAISPLCEQLKDELTKSIVDSVEEAKAELNKLEVYDFEQIVFRSSYQEGVWEADTLLRVFGIFHQKIARAKASANELLRDAADKVRSIVKVPYKPVDFTSSRVHEIANLELYERGEYLLEHRMPIALGDIFQRGVGGRKYILIEQPCDLMVRGDTGKRELNDVLLAEIHERSASDERSPPLSFVELPFLSIDNATISYAKMAKCVTIPIAVLDLCVFSDDGTAKFKKGAACPASAIPAWKKRFDVIQHECASLLGRFKGLSDKCGTDKAVISTIEGAVTKSVAGTLAGKVDMVAGLVSYNLKRISRLKEPRASGLLRKFAGYKARDAFDHNLTAGYEVIKQGH